MAGGIPALRPAGLPAFVPPTWWVRLLAYKALFQRPDLGVLAQFGALFSNPHGGIEETRMMFRCGLRWGLYDLRRGISEWTVWRLAARMAGIQIGPWMRCYTKDDVSWLIFTAIYKEESIVGINLEYTADGKTTITPDEVLDVIRQLGFDGTIVLVVGPWMEQDIQWSKLAARCIFLVEGYTNEGFVVHELVEHAYKLGARTVAVMAGIYPAKNDGPQSLAEWHALGGTTPILYLGDNLGADESRWARWSP